MARISQDDDSWKAGGVKRRDFRHTHEDGHEAEPEPEIDGWGLPKHPTTKSAKKNTKKWCKGVVGREHVVVTEVKNIGRWGYSIIVCSTCGKHVKYLWNPISL